MKRRTLLLSPLALRAREPKLLATVLANIYGQEVSEPVYTQTFALLGRLRAGAKVEEIRPLVDSFARQSPAKLTPSHLSGALIYPEVGLTEAARRLAGEASVDLYNQMSDGVFMGPPLLARVGMFDQALEHYLAIEKLCLRTDGLYRHSPLCEAAWGRGNAFPALGLALTLEAFPKKHPGYAHLLAAFQKHCQELSRHQTSGGMWRQVIDEGKAWEEYSATAMIGAAYRMGVRRKWLPKDPYDTAAREAYIAIDRLTGNDGVVKGVCESTGKQATLEAYLNRRAITGIDPRGGAMALWFATWMG
ncbi:MAG: glycoside hydrolase family 88 protein [Bryobacter sp.]|nr:glycoside hydrolase family 88 protein [Bryobacter sp.]